ncbi:IS1 family transposase [Ralstonia chuxiongensis]|uniref:IS1 family transposase n=1 Tax=Ralstonia chuxiongensis TaxID=2957504 RepID=UPI0028F5FBF4|nr:IS1 family transposase [Ralstonia chuxiongensis]CAJ0783350.1 IS1 family transposase ISOba3 [Ralstonia chuxiongensis]
MNRLDNAARAKILALLCEGMGINAACRISGASKMTVLKLLADAGEACAKFHDETVRGLKCKRVECDEVWSFVYCKEKNVSRAKTAPQEAGDAWTWTALDVDTKLMVSYLVANRDAASAQAFTDDLCARIDDSVCPQVTTDGLKLYVTAMFESFGAGVDYAQLVKMYGDVPDSAKGRYSPAECTGIKKNRIIGNPDMKKISTSYVERSNLTVRMQNRRFTRLTNGFSKKVENHIHAFALFVMHYNFCKVHKTLRVTPAMEAGLTDHIWTHEEIIGLLNESEQPKKRGPYKKRGVSAAEISN